VADALKDEAQPAVTAPQGQSSLRTIAGKPACNMLQGVPTTDEHLGNFPVAD
jgi:hypothetical protein